MNGVGQKITILPLRQNEDPGLAIKHTFLFPHTFSTIVNATSTEFSLDDISFRVLPPPVQSFDSVCLDEGQEYKKLSQAELANAIYTFVKEYQGDQILLIVNKELLNEKVNEVSLGLNLAAMSQLLLSKVYDPVTRTFVNDEF